MRVKVGKRWVVCRDLSAGWDCVGGCLFWWWFMHLAIDEFVNDPVSFFDKEMQSYGAFYSHGKTSER
jgi:hypothetical protein